MRRAVLLPMYSRISVLPATRLLARKLISLPFKEMLPRSQIMVINSARILTLFFSKFLSSRKRRLKILMRFNAFANSMPIESVRMMVRARRFVQLITSLPRPMTVPMNFLRSLKLESLISAAQPRLLKLLRLSLLTSRINPQDNSQTMPQPSATSREVTMIASFF